MHQGGEPDYRNTCLGPTSAYMGLGLEEAGWLKGRGEGIGAVTFCLKVNDLPPRSGSLLLRALPVSGTPAASRASGRAVGEEDATGAPKLSHPHLGPHHCSQLSPGMAPLQERE